MPSDGLEANLYSVLGGTIRLELSLDAELAIGILAYQDALAAAANLDVAGICKAVLRRHDKPREVVRGGVAASPGPAVLAVDNLSEESTLDDDVAGLAIGIVFSDRAEVVRVLFGDDLERRADLVAGQLMASVALSAGWAIFLKDDCRSITLEHFGGICAPRYPGPVADVSGIDGVNDEFVCDVQLCLQFSVLFVRLRYN